MANLDVKNNPAIAGSIVKQLYEESFFKYTIYMPYFLIK